MQLSQNELGREFVPVQLQEKQEVETIVISPFGRFNYFRLSFNGVFFYCWFIFFYWRLAFGSYSGVADGLVYRIDLALDLYFLLGCILINFFTGIDVENQDDTKILISELDYVYDMKVIFMNYLKRTLIFDLISMVPFVVELSIGFDAMEAHDWLYLLKFFRFFRMRESAGNLEKVNNILTNRISTKKTQFYKQVTEFIFMIMQLLLTIHAEACFWLLLGRVQNWDSLGYGIQDRGWIVER